MIKFIRKYSKRIKLIVLGVILFCAPFIIFGVWGEEPYDPFKDGDVHTGDRAEYYCSINGGNPITSSEYYDLKTVLGQRMAYAPVEDIYVNYADNDGSGVIVVDYEGDMFLDYKVMFDILTCRGEIMFASLTEDEEDVIIWLTNEDIASAMDNSSYSPSEGNEYGVLFRVEEESWDRYEEMREYSAETGEEIFVFLDGEILDSFVYVDDDGVPSKNTGYGNLLVRTDSIEENTRLMVVGACDELKISIERKGE